MYREDSKGNKIHWTAVVSDLVNIGENNTIHAGAVIFHDVFIGNNNTIGCYSVIGGDGETKREKEFTKSIIIGDNNLINHHVTIDRGNVLDTEIGNNCYIMTKSHIGHDCVIYDNVTISSGANVGGFCTIEEHVNIGLNAEIHQRKTIGRGAMIGMGASITKDVQEFAKVVGVNRVIGVNERKKKLYENSGINNRL